MSKHRQLVEQVAVNTLGYPLSDWIDDQRQASKSWRTIASELTERTEGTLTVSWETLRTWYNA